MSRPQDVGIDIPSTEFQDSFSKEVWESTYKDHNDSDINSSLHRVASYVATAEETEELQELWTNRFYDMLSEFKCTSGGRIYANAGTEWGGTTMMNCFTPDAEVLTSRGPKQICDVEVGDYVLTHKGRYRQVVNTLCREYDGTVQRFSSRYTTHDIVSTPEHPFYQGGDRWSKSEDTDTLVLAHAKDTDNLVVIDIANLLSSYADNLIITETTIRTKKSYRGGNGANCTKVGSEINRNIVVDQDVAYMLGRFVGDGCTFKNNQGTIFEKDAFTVAFNLTTEKDQADGFTNLIESVFGQRPNLITSTNNTLYVRKANQLIAQTLHLLVGSDFSSKRIPAVIWESPVGIQQKFLCGLYDADGFVTDRGGLCIEMTNPVLVREIQTLATICGIPASRAQNRLYSGATYTIDFRKSLTKPYKDNRLEFVASKRPNTGPIHLTDEGYAIVPERIDEEYSGYVYNISVDQDESYVVNNVVVHNCFVSPRSNTDIDSLPSIINDVLNQAQTLKSEGGWGQNFSWIRPRGAFINGIGVETPGSVKYMEVYDKVSDVITSGSGKKSLNKKAKGKIRKGAMMGVLDVWHPDVEEFIRAKQSAGRLSKFNISVNCTDKFMEKVIKVHNIDRQIQELIGDADILDVLDSDDASKEVVELAKLRNEVDAWDLIFPDTTHPAYKEDWDGNIQKWTSNGHSTVVYKTISAAGLWKTIMESTYNRAEPGVLFLDRANHFGPLNYLETIFATNPSMPAGTLIHTDSGIFPIEHLEDTNFNVKSMDGEWAPATCRLSGDNEELLEISLGANRTIRSTKEHRWPVYDTRMKRVYKAYAHELKAGDLIPLNRNERIGIYGDNNLTRDEGFFVGYVVGDGWFSRKNTGEYNVGITFGSHEMKMAERVLSIVNNLKTRPSTITKKESGELCIQFSCRELTQRMIDVYKMIPGEKNIPESVWRGNDNFTEGFVDGLLSADGCISHDDNKQRVVLTTSRENLAKQFGKLLGFAGVPVSIWHKSVESTFPNKCDYEKTYERWDVAVHGRAILNFFNVFDISHPDKHQKLEQVVTWLTDHKHKSHQQSFVKVIGVKPAGNARVWDISVKHNQHVFPTEWCYTGNCGEQMLAPGGVCNLGSLNLTQFVNKDGTGFDLDKIKKYTRYLNRFLDNINSLSNAPLPEYVDSMRNKRRVGIGILGWGSALFMLKVRFGSEEADKLRDEVMSTIAKEAYMSSIDLAEEKGMFKYCNPLKHSEGAFIQSLGLSKQYINKLITYGIRNSSLLSIQPTGNTSILANVVSGGLEPIFMPEYVRTVIVNNMPEEIADVCPKWYEGEWKETEMFKFAKEGDEEILRGEHNGTVYKIDVNRGLTKEVLCQDYGVRYLDAKGEWDPEADWAVTTLNLDVKDHVNDLKGFARWVDSAMSKCVAEGTLLSTNKGIIPIEQLGDHNDDQEGFVKPNDDYTILDEHGDVKHITSHYYGQSKPCADVRFNNGFTLTAAYTHKLKTHSGWKRIAELKAGDKVFYRTNSTGVDLNTPILPQPEFAANAINTTFPSELDEDFAMLLGMWVADGSVTNNSISICEKNELVHQLCKRLMSSLFGTHKVSLDTRWDVHTHYVHSRAIAAWFKKHVGSGSVSKRVPDFILRSPLHIQRAFIEGLTLDGYLKHDEHSLKLVIFDGYAKDVADKLISMLASMGIEYSLCTRTVGDNQTTYGVTAYLTDKDSIVPIEEHKQHYVPSTKKQKQTFVSDSGFDELISEQPHNTYGSVMRARLRKSQSRGNYVRMSFLDKCGYSYDDSLTCVTITDIIDVGNKKVYDIEVEDTHSYLINGVVSHNTVNVPQDYSFDDFQDIYLESYKSGFVKGVTTYRAGTMTSVLSAKEEKNADDVDEEIILDDIKLANHGPANYSIIRGEGHKWYLTTIMDEEGKRPVAMFVHTNVREPKVATVGAIDRLLQLAKDKGIPTKWVDDTEAKIANDNNSTKIARCISLNLRHGVLIKNVVAALEEVEDVYVGTFLFQIKKYLMTWIKEGEKVDNGSCPECGATESFVYSEGCIKCSQCGYSKCG